MQKLNMTNPRAIPSASIDRAAPKPQVFLRPAEYLVLDEDGEPEEPDHECPEEFLESPIDNGEFRATDSAGKNGPCVAPSAKDRPPAEPLLPLGPIPTRESSSRENGELDETEKYYEREECADDYEASSPDDALHGPKHEPRKLPPIVRPSAKDHAGTLTSKDLASADPIGANGAIGNGVTGDWDAPDLSLLEGPAIPAPPFPVEVLGPYWADWCALAAKGANAPVDYTATALVTIAAGLIGNARRVAVTPSWEEPATLWAVVVGVPSSGKSPALDPLTSIVAAYETDMARDFEQTLQTYTAELELAAQKKEGWKTSVKAAAAAGNAPQAMPVDAQEPKRPQRPRIMIADTTMEAAAEIAAANPKGLTLSRDELGGWWRSFDRYGGDGERQFWLQAHGARPHTVDRKSLGRPLLIPRLSVSVLGGTQPEVLAELLDSEEDGFASRFIYCFPDPVSGFTLSKCPIDLDGAQTALQRLRDLALVNDGQSDLRPFICGLAPEAAIVFEHWWGERRTEATHHAGVYGAWLGKAGGLALRLALVLEHLRWCATPSANGANSANSFPEQVSLDALQSAIRLIDDWAAPMARRAFGTAAISHEEADAAALARWLKRTGRKQFNARDIRRSSSGPTGRLIKSHHMVAACKKLEDAGLIRFVGTRAGNKAGRAPLDYEVNPALLAI